MPDRHCSCALLTRVDKTGGRELRAPVTGSVGDDQMIAPVNQNIRHSFGQYASSGNGQQVTLAFGLRVLHERVVIEPHGVRQHRGGHFDRIVERQHADHL